MTPNDILWHPDNPEGLSRVTRINELPASPQFFAGRWPELIGIIVTVPAETVFVAVVMLTGVKDFVFDVFPNIGFERPILLCR